MRILLDENLPRKLKYELVGHEVATAPEMGWAGVKNGELLRRMEAAFDVFVTADQNLQFQQNLRSRRLAIVVLVAHDNRFVTLRRLVPELLQALTTLTPGALVWVGPPR